MHLKMVKVYKPGISDQFLKHLDGLKQSVMLKSFIILVLLLLLLNLANGSHDWLRLLYLVIEDLSQLRMNH